MVRYKCTLAYDGTNFLGYQVQPNLRTVQAELEKALKKMHNYDVKVVASGRTDTGVHARGQVIHFDSSLNLTCQNWQKALNSLLPIDIAINSVNIVVDDFHARYWVSEKEYRYFIKLIDDKDPFSQLFYTQIKYKLNIGAINRALQLCIGTHDFTSFCASRTGVKDKIRTIKKADIIYCEHKNEYIFSFVGNGFLYNMVRIMVGTLLDIGLGKRNWQEMKIILLEKNRHLAGKTAPPQGLYLWRVGYK